MTGNRMNTNPMPKNKVPTWGHYYDFSNLAGVIQLNWSDMGDTGMIKAAGLIQISGAGPHSRAPTPSCEN